MTLQWSLCQKLSSDLRKMYDAHCQIMISSKYLQGPPWLSVQSKLALTDRNMHAKKILKVVLRSWGCAFFGTTTHFYEMHTVCPPLDPMLVTFSFKNKISIFVQFLSKICLFFLLIPIPYDSINAKDRIWEDSLLIL